MLEKAWQTGTMISDKVYLGEETLSKMIPVLERMLDGKVGFTYMAASMILSFEKVHGHAHEDNDSEYYCLHVRDITKTKCSIHAKYQYLISKCYVKFKKDTCSEYDNALNNIDIYENKPELLDFTHL